MPRYVELGGAQAWFMHALGAGLLLARLVHAQGLGSNAGFSVGRAVGATLTLAVILVAAATLLKRALVG